MPPLLQKSKQLGSKEMSLFRQLLQLHDERQYKKGVKVADTILKKNPEHGETLAMKGLILYNMGEKESGLDYVKRGVRLDLTSHIVWHVYGIVQRQEHKYEDALKSYTQALRHDSENVALIRDVCTLSTHLRQFEPLVEQRLFMLKTRPSMRSHWISAAVALDLAGHQDKALLVLSDFEGTLSDLNNADASLKYEMSEVYLYHISILEKLEKYQEALQMLTDKQLNISDLVAWRESHARILTSLDKLDEAGDAWRLLIQSNPENKGYYIGFFKTKKIDLTQNLEEKEKVSALKTLGLFYEQFPKAGVIQRLRLDLAFKESFKDIAHEYITSRLTKGVPSLFVDLKSLYNDVEKLQIIGDLVEGYRTELEKSCKYSSTDDKTQPTTSYIWTLYYLTQHYSQIRQYEKALETVKTAIEHTPTLPELYLAQGRTLKRLGNQAGACESVEIARELDGQDRFLNGKSAKYLIRNGEIEKAEQLLSLFTRKAAPSSAYDLCDMEALWFMREEAKSYGQKQEYGMALKRLHQVFDTFNQWEEDQYDFHIYCLRKYTIRSYLTTLKLEDELRQNKNYIDSAIEAVRIYYQLHDDSSLVEKLTNPQSGLPDKKAQKKAKKEKEKAAAQQKAKGGKDSDGLPAPVEDKDPQGYELLKTEEPLGVAVKILAPLANTKRIDLHHVQFEIAFRRGKYAQAMKALNKTASINPDCRMLHVQSLKLKQALESDDKQNAEVKEAIVESLEKIIPKDVNLESWNADYLQRNHHNPLRLLGAAEAVVLIRGEASAKEAVNIVFNVDMKLLDATSATQIKGFIEKYDSERLEAFRVKLNTQFPYSDLFKSDEQKENEKRAIEQTRAKRTEAEVEQNK
ncbi:N-terminal acetyltransferase A, auxiliary subunit [Wallemia mellicola]|uniref:N-terminal acetyltransferase A, auxiliary subunit n=2 Tax=Wallemia mellicola TaxID=1708541 RepID=A0A4T0SJX6_9BASI|nr:N-terminal acetyltransferase A, auxiliary subunit [Wallemia mellicola]TIC51490.1 N-terminal acetyltransferase A, auxiliary subunit [Wallemia mellicola]TIC62596.1 N-terminal acetyltransferase A, auxiliary subunit [Wallemia mellicola]